MLPPPPEALGNRERAVIGPAEGELVEDSPTLGVDEYNQELDRTRRGIRTGPVEVCGA